MSNESDRAVVATGARPEAVVRAFCAAWGEGELEAPNKEQLLSLVDDQAVWQVWVPNGPVVRGKAAIAEEIDRHLPVMKYLHCQIRNIASTDDAVFTERVDRFVSGEKTIDLHVVAIFEVSGDGRITAWREYFDTATIAGAMGMNSDALERSAPANA